MGENSALHPEPDAGFDPARAWRTDTPDFMHQPIYQFVLLEGYQEHSGGTWARKFAGTAMISKGAGSRFGYRGSDIDRIQADGDMIVVERVAGWVPASWPRWDWFTPQYADDRLVDDVDPEGREEPSHG